MKIPIPCVKQCRKNDCWICCSVMIYNYFFPAEAMDYSCGKVPSLIRKYMIAKHKSGDVPGSVSDFLIYTRKGFKVPLDERRIPKFKEEICPEIEAGQPLFCMVKDCTWEGGKPNPKCKDGHWIIICGYLETQLGNELLILDPDPNVPKVISIPYDDTTYFYRDGMYFQSTSYCSL